MNGMKNLVPLIGEDKTVLIGCREFDLKRYAQLSDKIFIHHVKESTLQRYDFKQEEVLRCYIEKEKCTQIIFLGSMDHNLIYRILGNESSSSLLSHLKFNLAALLGNKHDTFLKPALRTQLLLELNVIAQCEVLMDYYFIRPRVEKKELQIKGIVTDILGDKLKPVFYNGISYNDIISLN